MLYQLNSYNYFFYYLYLIIYFLILLILDNVGRISTAVLWLTNHLISLEDKIDIVENHFVDFICVASTPIFIDILLLILNIIQEHISDITTKDYNVILTTLKKKLNYKTMEKESRSIDDIKTVGLLLVANYSGKSLKYISEQEGWKKPGEELIKTFWSWTQ
jgi:hypothetical protein